MSGNSFGNLFRLSTFGESHGAAIGGIIDGCPAGLELNLEEIQRDLDRRKPGQSRITTQRKESDEVKFLSGLFEGKTTGTPIGFVIFNENQKSKDYSHIKDAYRPSHADYTYDQKYGNRDYRGGGRSSARETACRVVAGSIAQQLLALEGVNIFAFVSRVKDIVLPISFRDVDPQMIDNNPVRCPHKETADAMFNFIDEVRKSGNTVGGAITCVAQGVPVGWGEPVFDKLHADLAKAMLSINAVKGFEYGSGFEGSRMLGTEHNDKFVQTEDGIQTATNHSGGIQGGISNGSDINMNIAFKPVATIMQAQHSIDKDGKRIEIAGKGRHDPCVLPRAVPIVEAMARLVLADHFLRSKSSRV